MKIIKGTIITKNNGIKILFEPMNSSPSYSSNTKIILIWHKIIQTAKIELKIKADFWFPIMYFKKNHAMAITKNEMIVGNMISPAGISSTFSAYSKNNGIIENKKIWMGKSDIFINLTLT